VPPRIKEIGIFTVGLAAGGVIVVCGEPWRKPCGVTTWREWSGLKTIDSLEEIANHSTVPLGLAHPMPR
jgi:hypothetical protein